MPVHLGPVEDEVFNVYLPRNDDSYDPMESSDPRVREMWNRFEEATARGVPTRVVMQDNTVSPSYYHAMPRTYTSNQTSPITEQERDMAAYFNNMMLPEERRPSSPPEPAPEPNKETEVPLNEFTS